MPQYKILLARFPGRDKEHPDSSDWYYETLQKAKADPRVSEALRWRKNDTPIDMVRNQCVEVAKRLGVDYLLMLDNDMSPDDEPDGKPFWETSFDFAVSHAGPCIIAAPYAGPPPWENMYVFRWGTKQNDPHSPGLKLDQFAREEAAQRGGIEEVGALPTGVILIDMRAFARLRPPYFYYEWTDEFRQEKASTEDVTFTRDASLRGVPVYCNWDAWAGHHKNKKVRKPQVLTVDAIRENFVKAVRDDIRANEKVVTVRKDPVLMRQLERVGLNGRVPSHEGEQVV